jgi:hypothetical protein
MGTLVQILVIGRWFCWREDPDGDGSIKRFLRKAVPALVPVANWLNKVGSILVVHRYDMECSSDIPGYLWDQKRLRDLESG